MFCNSQRNWDMRIRRGCYYHCLNWASPGVACSACCNPFKAAELGYIDEVLMPRDTRPRLIAALKALENKRDRNPPRKHGNIPL